MKLIGIDLYQFLLTQALKQARGEDVDHWTPELNLEGAGRLPEEWIPELEVRLALYGRLARLRGAVALDAFEEELEDRFGALPEEAGALLEIARLRDLAREVGLTKVDAGPAAIAFTPRTAGAPPLSELEDRNGRWIAAERIEDAGERRARVAELMEQVVEARGG